MVAENCSVWGGGAAVDREEVDDRQRVKKVKKKKLGEEDTFPGNLVRAETARLLVELNLLSH